VPVSLVLIRSFFCPKPFTNEKEIMAVAKKVNRQLEKEIVAKMTPERRVEVKAALDSLEKLIPSITMKLNIAQYRALKQIYTADPYTGKLPDMASVEFANGVGKTHLLIIDMIGVTCGKSFLNVKDLPVEAIAYYDSLTELRDSGKLSLRLNCVSDDMLEGGSVFVLLKEIFPLAVPTKMDNKGCFKQIDIPHPTIPRVKNAIAVKTFNQAEVSLSGSTCQKIWINEPMPDSLFGETIGRIRSPEGKPDGIISMFATILDQANYVDEFADSKSFKLVRCKGHLFENCLGEEVTDEMAAEVYQDNGVQMQKNPDGKGYITNGVLKLSKIEAQIEAWAKTCPHQLKARKTGAPISAGAKLWPTYKAEVHSPRGSNDLFVQIPRDWPMVQVADPHIAKPTACIWAIVTGLNTLHIAREWPTYEGFGYYEALDEKRYTVKQTCAIWKQTEAQYGYSPHIVKRIGDPNRFKTPNPDNRQQLEYLYRQEGFAFWLGVNDNIEIGVDTVSEYFNYDHLLRSLNPEDPAGWPRLTIAERCVNTNRAAANFSCKKNSNRAVTGHIDEKYKDFADCLRYLCMWHKDNRFDTISVDVNNSAQSEESIMRNSRIPKRYREESEYGSSTEVRAGYHQTSGRGW
jgi:hypothetical protein